ncbi:MAG: Mediator of RNA polymerase II transcription subunit 7 [Alectoria fallacina]|uniref:Mediator of RNA polymerase II transcription subunit 7 n=1 Tax=Alectoria fallacina TaxID=1903189 RepID=A0A8H3I965_9LECA|nr:MAG: Mediator of RNA polymerase II transcription subunit 7 [Alectoria fallacina]
MADQPQPGTISAAFPAPPPFYKSFTPQNLESLQKYIDPQGQSTSRATQPISGHVSDLLSLPPELRNLVPPPPPVEGKYRSFGTLHEVSLTPALEEQQTPTPSRLLSLTHQILLTFLSLTNALATNPSSYGPIWDELHELFQEINKVINGYRPHQARETLILMLEEQLERVRGETKGVGEAVGRAREVIETLGKEGQKGTDQDLETDKMHGAVIQQSTKEQRMEKRTWEVLGREVGRI